MKKFAKLSMLLATFAIGGLVLAGCSKSSNNDKALPTRTAKTLTIGLEGTYAPYSYRQDGKLKGFEVELGKAIAKDMGLKAEFVPTKWDSLIAGLGANKFDMVLNNVTVTKEREKQFIFSDPYIFSQIALIVPKNSALKSIDDIKNKTFPEGIGTENANYAKKFGAKVVPVNNFQDATSLIKQGRAQGTLNAKEAFLSWKKDNPDTNLKYISLPKDKVPALKVSALMNKKSTKLQTAVNKSLATLRKDGTLKKLSNKYFIEDVTINK